MVSNRNLQTSRGPLFSGAMLLLVSGRVNQNVTIKLVHEWKKLGHRNELRLSREDCAALRRVSNFTGFPKGLISFSWGHIGPWWICFLEGMSYDWCGCLLYVYIYIYVWYIFFYHPGKLK